MKPRLSLLKKHAADAQAPNEKLHEKPMAEIRATNAQFYADIDNNNRLLDPADVDNDDRVAC